MLLGRLHAIGRRQPFAARDRLTLERFLDEPAQVVAQPGFLPAPLQARYQRVIAHLREAILACGLPAFPGIRTQGDCHPGNIIWTRDDGPWLVDFDDCQTAPAVQDLWMLLAGARHEQELQLGELLDGYEMFCEFDTRELALVEALRTLRMVHYAGWLARRWDDPAFPRHFPWFNTAQYWETHVAELEEQRVLLAEPPLRRL
jgi:Ser/Thr protein kinase RdoA (MazF antagonist)